MIFLLKKKKKSNLSIININMKYLNNVLYLSGKFGFLKIVLIYNQYLNINNLKQKLNNFYYELNSGWIGILFLNGLGFKSTRKIYLIHKRFWRFNVGHSHVFQYFSPKNVLIKTKTRYVCVFGYKKSQVYDITQKIKSFHIPDSYKGIGIKYPKEVIRLKKGKMRQ